MLITSQNFFNTLAKLKVRKSSEIYFNLLDFLKMNEQNKDLILFKKLVKVVEEFLKSHYFKSYGHQKTKLQTDEPVEDDEYEYEYDEEEGNAEEEEEEYYYDEEVPEQDQQQNQGIVRRKSTAKKGKSKA